jgi:hypothetical protein
MIVVLVTAAAFAFVLGAIPAPAAGPVLGPRQELTVFDKLHEAHVSAPAVAVTRDGKTVLAWFAQQGHDNNLFVARPGSEPRQVRVNPDGLFVDSLHQPPGLALGPGDEVYVSWSSRKPIPEGGLFASDLRLSRSLDGGRTFDGHLRVNEDRPISHSFEGLGVAGDGTVIVSWIDSRDGASTAGTYLARITERGSRVEHTLKLDEGETCVCCRVDVAAGPRDTVAVAWRKVFPGSIRDMVVGLSRDGGRSFTPAGLVHADRWKINACPHRGGSVAMDDRGRVYLAWYTETADGQPRMLFAASDGARFSPPARLNTATGSIPDQVRLAADPAGRVVIVWEEATAVRRRVLLRYSTDGGRTLSAPRSLSEAIKAYAPDVAVAPGGDFVVAWHEEQFPALKTVTQTIKLPK